MKKIILVTTIFIFSQQANAQWVPGGPGQTVTTDDIGISLLSPTSHLHIGGSQSIAPYSLPGVPYPILGKPNLTINSNIDISAPGLHEYSIDKFDKDGFNIMEVINTIISTGSGYNSGPLPYFVIKPSGKIGLGTNMPTEKLEIVGNQRIADGEIYLRSDNNHGLGWYGIVGRDSRIWNGQTIDGPVLYGYAGGALGSNQSGQQTTALQWNANGQVFIGGKQPINAYAGYALGVYGDIVCTRAVVQVANWADDVFDNNYQLPSLSQLQTYIDKYHHLEGVPTTTEVMEKGNDVGAMNAILLRKVEELTLYVLDLKKQNEAMQVQINILK